MNKKYVKDGKHNKFPAYCCEDIDNDIGARLQRLEEAVADLVAGTVPDGAVTLAKLADDARIYVKEINKGRLICEWIGTQEEYDAHVAENGGEPLANVRYTITDAETYIKVSDMLSGTDLPVGTSLAIYSENDYKLGDKTKIYMLVTISQTTGEVIVRAMRGEKSGETNDSLIYSNSYEMAGEWQCCGETGTTSTGKYFMFQRIE